jgi:hypothetical protein
MDLPLWVMTDVARLQLALVRRVVQPPRIPVPVYVKICLHIF